MVEAVHPAPRLRRAVPSCTTFELQAPPAVEPPGALQPVQLLLPLLGSLSMLVYGVMSGTPVLLVTGGIMALASLASPLVLHRTGSKLQRARLAARRERHRAHLDTLVGAVGRAKAELAAARAEGHPLPGAYDDWIAAGRLWERRPGDLDITDVRLGTADLPTGFRVIRQGVPPLDAEPDAELSIATSAFEHSATMLDNGPLVLGLADAGVVAVTGDRATALGLLRAVVLELALTCTPEDLRLVVAFPPGEHAAWEWAKWLPHAGGATGSAGPSERMLVTTVQDLERYLDALVTCRPRRSEDHDSTDERRMSPRVVLVLDRFDPLTELGLSATLRQTLLRAPDLGVSVLVLPRSAAQAPTQTVALVTMSGPEVGPGSESGLLRRLPEPSAKAIRFAPFVVDAAEAERVARRLAPKRLVADPRRAGRLGASRLADLLDAGLLTSARTDADRASRERACWPLRAPAQVLRVPFAVTAGGFALELDLKESAEGGQGPHGLVVGAVGSGKSELLRTLVAALAATHDPGDVEMAFADFKGGLTFGLLHQIPHCVGMITNLADDLTLVDRMKAALIGELERRQRLLRAAGGDVQKITQYRAVRRRVPALPSMPYLIVVVDEFGELLEARPDVLDVLLSLGRTGRSLGIHLLLATQRLEPGRIRGLDSYLGYRICLRTFTAEDSVTAVGSRVAADLPALPGHGYLRTATGLTRFLTATVSAGRGRAAAAPTVRPFPVTATGAHQAVRAPSDEPGEDADIAVLVREARRAGRHRPRSTLWLPPLPRPDQASPLTVGDPRLETPPLPAARGLPVPVGLVDLPAARRQVPFVLDPAELDGHLIVVGAPGVGKSTVLASYAVCAAARFPASLLQFQVLDLGGGTLAPLAALPNVGACVDGQDEDAVHSVLFACEQHIQERRRRFRRHAIPSIARLRELVAAGDVSGPAHTVLLLDQLVSFRERFPDLEAVLARLIVEGPSAGVHVAMTSTRWAELPAKRLEQVSNRLELRLNDVLESQHGRAAAVVPAGVPGRGLTRDAQVVQIAAPHVTPATEDSPGGAALTGDTATTVDLSGAVAHVAGTARLRWPGVVAPRIRGLSDLAEGEWGQARRHAAAQGSVLIGIAEPDLAPVHLDPGRAVTVLSYGDAGTGRTRLLARLLTESAQLRSDDRPLVYVLDYLGALLDRCANVATGVAAAYGPRETPELFAALTDELNRRHAALTVARRRGSEVPRQAPIWLLADDYDLVHATARPGLVGELANVVPYAAPLGFTVVLNQVASGSGARVDPLVRRMLEANAWHLQFGVESRVELLLRGTRGALLPPGQALLTRPRQADTLVAVLPPAASANDDRPAEPGPEQIRLVS